MPHRTATPPFPALRSANIGRFPPWLRLLLVVVLALGSLPPATPTQAEVQDWDILNGRFFPQTGNSGPEPLGYAITDDGGIPFWSAFERLGGVPALGYPITSRFDWDGAVVQATQRAALQWDPAQQQVTLVDLYDRLHQAGKDPWLLAFRDVPQPAPWAEAASNTPLSELLSARLRVLDDDPGLLRAYWNDQPYPALLNGLPTTEPVDRGPYVVLRTQRTAFRRWKVDAPEWGARAGDIVRANAGEDAKLAGLFPESAALHPAPPPAPGLGVPYPGRRATADLERLVPDLPGYVARRSGTVSVAVYSGADGQTYGHQAHVKIRTASIVKVAIMAAMLHRIQQAGRKVSPQEHQMLASMIHWSDNAAASALLARAGGAKAVQEYLERIGLTETEISGYAWGYSLTTASDMVKLVAQLHFRQILTPELCEYALQLMREVVPAQRWGVSFGVPAEAQVALKNGWYPENDGSNWRVHSIGAVEGGKTSYVVAVLTQYPQRLGMLYGQESIAGISARVSRSILGQ